VVEDLVHAEALLIHVFPALSAFFEATDNAFEERGHRLEKRWGKYLLLDQEVLVVK